MSRRKLDCACKDRFSQSAGGGRTDMAGEPMWRPSGYGAQSRGLRAGFVWRLFRGGCGGGQIAQVRLVAIDVVLALHDERAHLIKQSLIGVLTEAFLSADCVVEIGPVVESGDRDELRTGLAEAILGEVVSRGSALFDCRKDRVFLEVKIIVVLVGADLRDKNANHLGLVAVVGQAERRIDDVDFAVPARSALDDMCAE